MGLKVFFYIAEAKEENRKPPDNGAVLRKFYSGGSGITHFLRILKKNGFIRQVGGKRSGYVPVRPSSEISAVDLMRMLLGYPENFEELVPTDELQKIVWNFSIVGLQALNGEHARDVQDKTGNT